MNHIPQLFKRVAGRFGVDRAVAYAVFAQLWSVVAGPISVFLILRCLTVEEQGFYYTFGSLLAAQMFFELGLTTLLVTFAAHESAQLSWTQNGELIGSKTAESRLSSLLRSSMAWYATLAAGFGAVALPLGFFFFAWHSHGMPMSVWLVAWIGLVISTSLNLLIVPCVAVLEGCGLVKEANLARFGQTIASNAVFWVVLLSGGRLLSAMLSSLFGWTVMCLWVLSYRRLLLGLLRRPSREGRIDWRREIWPLQWKLAFTWISGYFIFQLFNPILFIYQGPAAAARMGMSLNLTNRISGLALTWMSTKVPTLGSLVARRQYRELDQLFLRSSVASSLVAFLLAAMLWILVYLLRLFQSPYADRMLDLTSLALLAIAMLVGVVNYCQSIYMRAHKEEPLVYVWMVLALLIGASTYYFGRYYGTLSMVASYCSLMILCCIFVVAPVFVSKWKWWHKFTSSRDTAGPI
jgi:O-antigen/teichoic acid export membrane protein